MHNGHQAESPDRTQPLDDAARPIAVGLIGVGTMGSRICAALSTSDHSLTIWDIDDDVLDRQRELGVRTALSAAEVASVSDIVLLSLPMDRDVEEVVAGPEGLLSSFPPPSYIVDLSTVEPQTSQQLALRSGECGVAYLDAPVLGRPARCGSWTLVVGGEPEDLSAISPVLVHLAERIILIGPVGAGNTVKLLNNLMFGAINAITVECLAAATKLGISPSLFYKTIVESGAATVSNLFRELGPKIVDEDFTPVFSLALLDKDNRLALKMLERSNIGSVIGQAVAELNRRGIAAGLDALDTSSLVRVVAATATAVHGESA